MFIKEWLKIFRVYQFCGFAPFPIPFEEASVRKKNQMKWYIYNGILVIYFGSLVVHNIVFYRVYFVGEKKDMLGYLSFMIISAVRTLAVIIAIESIQNVKQQISFLQQFETIDQIFLHDLGVRINYKKMRRVASFWLAIWLTKSFILVAMVLADIIREDTSVWNKILWFFLTVPLVTSVLRYFQIIDYIVTLGYRFELINARLNEINATTSRLSVSGKILKSGICEPAARPIDRGIYDEIVALRRIFHMLWENTFLMNAAFRWSNLLLIATSFVIILVNYYRILIWLFIKKDPAELEKVIVFTIWSSGHAFYFIKLANTCHHILQEVQSFISFQSIIHHEDEYLIFVPFFLLGAKHTRDS